MRFKAERDVLLDAIQRIQSVVEKKNAVQILANVLCTVADGKLSLAATDLEVGIRITLPVESSEDGKITLSAKNFLDIVKELPSRPVQVARKNNDWVEIVSGKSKFNIVSLAADEYPALPSFEEKKYSEARTEALRDMIDKTAFAVSTDATRYHLNGVFFEQLEANVMRMTATDGHRLSFVDQEVFLAAPDFKRGMIIPKKGLMELRKLLDSSTANTALAFERGYLFAHEGDTYLFVRLIEGEYPDYRQVIPKEVGRVARINRNDLMAALRRVSLLAHEKSRGVKLSFDQNQLTISSSNPDMGDALEEIDVDVQGESMAIGFNARYLLDCLAVVGSDEIEFSFKDRLNPGVVRGSDRKNHTYVIMPMRI